MWEEGDLLEGPATIRWVVQKRGSPGLRSPEVGISVSGRNRTSGKEVLFYLVCVAIRLYLSVVKIYREDITWPLGDTKFPFEC